MQIRTRFIEERQRQRTKNPAQERNGADTSGVQKNGPHMRLGTSQKNSSRSKLLVIIFLKYTHFLRGYVPPRSTVQSLAIQTQGRKYITESVASVHMMGRTMTNSDFILDLQTANGFVEASTNSEEFT